MKTARSSRLVPNRRIPTHIQQLIDHPSRGGCGVGAIADLRGPSHGLIDEALAALVSMEHRGGALDDTGDGAGLLFTLDAKWFSRFVAPGKHVPEGDHLSVGVVLFPLAAAGNIRVWQEEIDAHLRREGLAPLGWRRVPVDESALGRAAAESRREVWQVLIGEGLVPPKKLAIALWRAKEHIELAVRDVYLASFTPRTVVYKALCTGEQLGKFYLDFHDPELTTQAVVFHRRYSTNTFSDWLLAQPFRTLAHNGEINTIKATRDAARNLAKELGFQELLMKQGSDSADLDRVIEVLTAHGVPLLEALLRLMPPAHGDEPDYPRQAALFHRGVQRAMGTLGAWEGPAALVATDGDHVVATLDRMGLRPLRWLRTHQGKVAICSEIGCLNVDPADIAETRQLDPGQAFAVDLTQGKILQPHEVVAEVLRHTPLNVGELAEQQLLPMPSRGPLAHGRPTAATLTLAGWTAERVRTAKALAEHGAEPMTSMGYDRPLAALSPTRPPLYKYFRQIIAVVTNPPIDPIREGSAIDLGVFLGRTPRAYSDSNEYRVFPQVRAKSPFLTEAEVRGLLTRDPPGPSGHPADAPTPLPDTRVIDATYPIEGGSKALSARLAFLAAESVRIARKRESAVLVLSDAAALENPQERLMMPMLLLVGAMHSALVRHGLRRRLSLVAVASDVQEPHDGAVLLANGADAICPTLAFSLAHEAFGNDGVIRAKKAFDTGLRRILSKMGITSVDGYRGSRLFEAVGIAGDIVEFYLPGTTSRLGGLELGDIDSDIRERHRQAQLSVGTPRSLDAKLYRKEVLHQLQLVARGDDPGAWGRFMAAVQATPPVYLRDLLDFHKEAVQPLPLDQVAPAREVAASTFVAAAMSHGALHRIAHRAIAGAFNELGAFSNSGEGGEDTRRNPGGAWQADRSRIRQVASARFGVDAAYLRGADELQIKIGQGAKPGEGGHLPGEKVTAEIAAIRRCPPGVTLISPPPHHDIYSIEDLAQLIHNLRAVHPKATISVKCPSTTDLGTIVVGVAKAGADVIDISGAEGGTGAAAASSIEHAGLPVERGLAEAHQALVVNGIRNEVRLRADGGIKTGDDVVKLLCLGADEVALGTALMIAEQCIFCHGCSKGTCPSGITTQDQVVFQRFMVGHGEAKRALPVDTSEEERYQEARRGVVHYLLALAEAVRQRLAELGVRSPRELTGRVDLLDQISRGEPRADKLDLSALLYDARPLLSHPEMLGSVRCAAKRLPATSLNFDLWAAAQALTGQPIERRVRNVDRAVGATLAGELAAGELRPKGTLDVVLRGEAGQGLGFACVDGLHLTLHGQANDGVGEAISGGRIVVRQPRGMAASEASVAGNAVGYGAVGGEIFLQGRAGQRFGVRNSGGTLVCEGAGKYAFEYMTDGTALVLGGVGPLLGSGMTGGVVYLWDPASNCEPRLSADVGAMAVEPEEIQILHGLLRQHHQLTASPAAGDVLKRWPASLGEFAAIRPSAEVARRQAARAAAEAAALAEEAEIPGVAG